MLLERYWDQVGGVDVVEPLPAGDEPCPACGQPEPGPTCWLCSYTWLAQARQQYEADLELSSLEVDHQFEALATASQKRWQLDDLTGWADRLRMVVEAYAVHGRRGRAVELLADLLARDAAARTTMRGRPSTLARIAGVLAVDADWQSGRRAMPGRDRSAQFAGCTPESVTHMWRRCEALEWADIVVVGGRNTMDERIRFGRTNRRSEWNLMPLHTSTVPSADRAAQIPRALAVLGDLLQRALQLIDEATDELETALARAERWIDWPERVAAIQRRQAMARLVDDLIGQNLFRAHSVSRGEYVSSCSVVGLQYSRPSMIDSVGVGLEPAERRGRASGASRSSRGGDAQRRKRPVWEKWAYRLGRDLTSIWPWLARSPQYWVAATLGAALGPDWTAQQVIDLIRQRCGPPAPAETIHAPAAYLRELLRCALRTGQAALHEARAESEQRRAAVAADRERLRAQQQQTRDADAAQRAAAAAATGTGRAAAREAAAAAARAAARRAAAPPVGRARISGPTMPVESWPDVIQPGSGHREGQDPASNEIMKREDYPQ